MNKSSSDKSSSKISMPRKPLFVRFLKNLGFFLNTMGVRYPRLDTKSICKKAGFVPEDCDTAFLLRSNLILEDREALIKNFFMRIIRYNQMKAFVHQRSLIRQWLVEHPETRQIPIEHPIFVVGHPRTGTTLLYNLLAMDPALRAPLSQEILHMIPPQKPSSDKQKSSPLKEYLVKAYLKLTGASVAHHTELNSPQEFDMLLWISAFPVSYTELSGGDPIYAHIIAASEEERRAVFSEFRTMVQVLQFYSSNKRFMSKSPFFTYFLKELLETFPGAYVIRIHRDPMESIPSWCKLQVINRSFAQNEDEQSLKTVGKDTLTRYLAANVRGEEAYATFGSQILDVKYPQLVADPVGTIKALYGRMGCPFTEVFEKNMREWLVENPQHKHGVHTYNLEAFGLDRERIEAVTADYRRKYL